jgi:hypothetical protein
MTIGFYCVDSSPECPFLLEDGPVRLAHYILEKDLKGPLGVLLFGPGEEFSKNYRKAFIRKVEEILNP